jgi:hypothetical protein
VLAPGTPSLIVAAMFRIAPQVSAKQAATAAVIERV